MKNLILGATGTVGTALIQELSNRQLPTIAASRTPENKKFPKGIDKVFFDYENEASVEAALEGVDNLFVLAPPGMPEQVEKWQTLFSKAQQKGVRHVVLMTSKGAGDDTPHGKGEAALKASGLSWTLLRPTFFAQNFATYARDSICKDGAFYYPAGEGLTAFVDVRDIASVAAEVLAQPSRHEGKAYALTGPFALSMQEVAKVLSSVVEKSIRYVEVAPADYQKSLERLGMPSALASSFTYLYSVVVKNGWAAEVTQDVEKILGRPARRFESFAKDSASVWK